MSDGAETDVLPGMGDLPERVTPVPADEGKPKPDRPKRASAKGRREPAETLPVARVAVDMSLPHLDRPFDYLVPATLDATAVPGCRVRVRFAGQLVDGYLLERAEHSDHEGRLVYLERVTSPEPVLAPEIAALAREIADRYAGTLADVLRLAVPPRHARVEAEGAGSEGAGSGDTTPETAPQTDDAADAPQTRPAGGTGTRPAEGPGMGDAGGPEMRSAVRPGSAEEPKTGPADAPDASMPVRAAGVAGPVAAPGPGQHVPGGQSAPEGASTGYAHTVPAPDASTAVREAGVAGPAAIPEPGTPVPGGGAASEGGGASTGAAHALLPDASAPVREAGVAGPAEVPGAGPLVPGGGSASEGGGASAGLAHTLPPDASAPVREAGVADPVAAPGPGTPVPGGGAASEEGGASTSPAHAPLASVEVGPWQAYPAGPSFLGALAGGRAPRAVWSALPGHDWTPAVARAVSVVLASGRGALVVVADGRDVARVDAALAAELGPGRHVALTAELGPAERYRRWLAVRRGKVQVVAGTRAAVFAPVRDLGLVVLWDDGDDVHAEPHAPYPHAREVLGLRAHRAKAGALIGGFTTTTDAAQLVAAGWAAPLVPARDRLRAAMPYVRPAGDDAELARDEAARSARLPHLAFRAARQGLEHGPVLVQVPRRGYVPALACSRCRGPARCPECEGPLSLRSSHAAPYCRWCGRIAGAWTCPECGGRQVRAVVVGARRTAEELGRAFPGVPVRTSGKDGVLAAVGAEPALVVATPGAEPVAEEGYAAALLLDGWVLLGRADLRAGEEALRRWMNAAALVRPRGPVVVLADGSLTPVQALIRWDAVTYAERELAERRDLGFPPAVRMASLTGTPQAIRELVEAAGLPPDAEVLGPVEAGEGQERALVRVQRSRGAALSRLLKAAQAARSSRKATDVVRVRVDPLELI